MTAYMKLAEEVFAIGWAWDLILLCANVTGVDGDFASLDRLLSLKDDKGKAFKVERSFLCFNQVTSCFLGTVETAIHRFCAAHVITSTFSNM